MYPGSCMSQPLQGGHVLELCLVSSSYEGHPIKNETFAIAQ